MTALLTLIAVVLQLAQMRGGAFHNFIVGRCATALRRAGFAAELEAHRRLADGRLDAIDLVARRGEFTVAVEVETTPRGVASNAEKALALALPLWIVVPDRRVQRAAHVRLVRAGVVGGERIQILLLPAFEQGLRPGGDLIAAANGESKSKTKTRKDCP